MKKTKIISLALVLVLVLALFSGCAGKNEANGKTSGDNSGGDSQTGDVFDMDGADGNTLSGDAASGGGTVDGSTSGSNQSGSTGSSGKTNSSNKSGGTSSTASQAVGSLNTESDNKFPGRATDLKGKTVTVHAWNTYMLGNDSSQPKLSQMSAEMNKKIEKAYNCKLNIYYSSASEPFNDPQLKAAVSSGKPKTDIWWLNVSGVIDAYKSNFLVELDALKVMDFDDSSRYTNATNMLAVDGKHYGIGPKTYGIKPVFTNFIMFANTTLLNDVGVPLSELESLQTGNKWNWANFEAVAKKVKDNGAAKGYKTYAINDYSNQFYQALMNANGTDWISRASNGSMTFSGGDTKGQNVLTYYSNLVQKGYVSLDNLYHLEQFAKGDLAFIISPMFTPIYHSSGWKFDYTMMYPPMGNDVKSYTTCASEYTFAVIPKGVKPSGCTDAEIATILDAINTTLISSSEDTSLASIEMAKYMKNNLAKETVMSIYKNKEYGIVWPIMTQSLNMYKDWQEKTRTIASAGGSNMSSVLNSVSTAYNTQLKDLWKH